MAKKNESADKIIDAFISLVQINGYNSISISDITNKAGVSRISFYRNFPSIEDVMGRFIERVLQETISTIKDELLNGSLEKYFSCIYKNLSTYSSVISELCQAGRGEMILSYFNEHLFDTPLSMKRIQFDRYEKLFFREPVIMFLSIGF